MTIICFETSNNKSKRDKRKNTFHSTEKGYIILGQNAIKKKKKKKILYLGLCRREILLGVSFLGRGTLGLRLQLHILDLGDYILDAKGILGRLGFH